SKLGRLALAALFVGEMASVAEVRAAAVSVQPAVLSHLPLGWDRQAWQKLDESLRNLVESGCTDSQSVIVRPKPGSRGGLRDSLKAHGNKVAGEFATINAVAATVSCSDLQTLASFQYTLSVSSNARVTSDALGTLTGGLGQSNTPRSREVEGEEAAVLQAP